MSIPVTSIEGAEHLVEHFSQAKRVGPYPSMVSGEKLVDYSIPDALGKNQAASFLLLTALQMMKKDITLTHFAGNPSEDIPGELRIVLPASYKQLPADDIRQSLHRLCRLLQNGMERDADGMVILRPETIDQLPPDIDARKLLSAILQRHCTIHGVTGNMEIEASADYPLHPLPEQVRYMGSDGQLRTHVDRATYARTASHFAGVKGNTVSERPTATVLMTGYAAKAIVDELDPERTSRTRH